MTFSPPATLPPSFWFSFIVLTIIYIIFLIWFSRNRRICAPIPDSFFVHKENIDRLTQDISHLLVDDLSIEIGDESLGKGVNGFVFKGYALPNGHGRFKEKLPAAIKTSVAIPSSSVRLLEEASRISRLDHPHIIKILAVSGTPHRPVLALEWLVGGSLQNYFRKSIRAVEDERDRPVILLRDILHIFCQVASALQKVHSTIDINGKEMIHGDISSRNVLLSRKELRGVSIKLGDFGLPEGLFPRPIAWLPPEMLCANHSAPKQTSEGDIWMFGVFMWECLTLGATPHYQRSVEDIQRCLRLPDRGLDCPNSCPLDVWTAVLECLSDRAHRRPIAAGSDTGSHSLVYRLDALKEQYLNSQHRVYVKENISSCVCPEHRCRGTQLFLNEF